MKKGELAVSSRPDYEEESSKDDEEEEEEEEAGKEEEEENKSLVPSSKRNTCQTFRLEGDVEQYREIATQSATKV